MSSLVTRRSTCKGRGFVSVLIEAPLRCNTVSSVVWGPDVGRMLLVNP